LILAAREVILKILKESEDNGVEDGEVEVACVTLAKR
jgi:hypothetical protein